LEFKTISKGSASRFVPEHVDFYIYSVSPFLDRKMFSKLKFFWNFGWCLKVIKYKKGSNEIVSKIFANC